MKVSPHTHPESPLTGSTLANLIDKAKEMGRTHFAYTDNGHLSSAMKAYTLCKPSQEKKAKDYQKKAIQMIPGIEIYFKDSACPLVTGTKAARCKYFTATLYARTQDAYQALVKEVSKTDFPTVDINGESQQLWSWKNLENLAQKDIDLVAGGPHCMIGKVMLAGEPLVAQAMFLKLKELFKDKFFTCILAEPWEKKWNNVVEITFTDGTKKALLASDMVATDKARNMKAIDLTEKFHHSIIKSISVGNTYFEVDKAFTSAKLHKGFLPLPGGDITLKTNKLLLGLSRKHGVKVLVTDYAYYASKEDKLVQTMRMEGTNKLQPNLHMKSEEEIYHYLFNVMKLPQEVALHIFEENTRWGTRFNQFKLDYKWHLADSGPDALKQAMKIIKDTGRMKWDDPKYVARLKEELDVIAKNPKFDLTPYFLPIRDVLNYYKEAGFLTGPGRGCLTGDAKVLTSEGFKSLKDIIAGDRVFSHTGEIRNVTDTMEYDVKENLLEIASDFSFGTIKLTKDHKLFGVKSKNTQKYDNFLKTEQTYVFKEKKTDIDINAVSWMKAEEFSVGDYLFMPWIKNRKVNNIQDLDLSRFCSNILDISHEYIEYGTETNKTKIVRNLHFNPKLVRIIGRWIGDGWINSDLNSKTVGIAYHSDDVAGQDEFFSLMVDLGFKPKKILHKTKKLVQIVIHSAILHGAFRYLFPDYKNSSKTKHIGQFMSLEDSLLRELLIGLQQADGHVYSSGGAKGIVRESIDTTSYRLANEIKQALLYLKIPSSISIRKSYIHPYNDAWECAQSYKVRFKGLTTPKSQTIIENESGYLAKISNIQEMAENKVYDITVEKDHSYITSNYAVHNSAGGSLFAYCLGITQIDPFKYDLPFQRFFSLDRIMSGELPDIDVDLEDREPLVGADNHSGYLYGKYGDKAAQISTRTTVRLKSAILDTNRYFHGKVEESVSALSKSLPPPPQGVSDLRFVFGYTDDEDVQHPGLLEINEDLAKYAATKPQEWEIVSKAMGITRAFSKHASAFVVADIPISDIVPTKDGNVTQYEAKACEAAGLIKYDFLVVTQLKDIRVCLELINKKHGEKKTVGYFNHKGKETYIWDLMEEMGVFHSIWSGDVATLFQINTRSMAPFVVDILPGSVMDLATILALVRPGPMDFIDPETGRNMVEEYVLRRRGEGRPDIKELADLLPETFGILCIKEGSKVKTKEGLVPIQNVRIGSLVQTEDGSYQKVLKNIYKGESKIIKIRLDNSEELALTPDHKVLTSVGWKAARDLSNRDLVKHFWISDKKIPIGDDRDWLVGLILADGNISTASPSICAGNNKEHAFEIKQIADRVFNLQSEIYWHCRSWHVRLVGNTKTTKKNSNPVTAYLRKLKIYGLNSFTKVFPKKITKAMITGFIEGDGNTSNGCIRIKNRLMTDQIFETLQALRIKSSRFDEKDVNIVSCDMSNFDFKLKKKVSKEKGLFYPKPDWKISRELPERQYFTPKNKIKIPFISNNALINVENKTGLRYDRTQTWSKVVSVRDGEKCKVYDLSIEKIHSFVVGGNVVHNCFQEQLNKIARDIGGFPGPRAETLRKHMAKKNMEKLEEMKPDFLEGASKKVSPEVATGIWERMVTFGRYGFSVIHAVEYAHITYACMYLKHHYPMEWWAAILTNAKEQEITGVLWPYVREFVLPPDINLSGDTMVVDYANEKIRSKLGVIRGIGENTIDPIVNGRPYADINDFVAKDVAGSSLSHKLIHVGVLDSLFPPKTPLLEKLQIFENAVEAHKYRQKLTDAEKTGKKVRLLQPKPGVVPEEYINIPPLKDVAMKKAVLPSLPIDLHRLARKHSKYLDKNTNVPIVIDRRNEKDYRSQLINGEQLKRLDEMSGETLPKDVYVACTAFVIQAKEFAYSKNTKKALKLVLDIDGYVSEKVLWPEYETGKLAYPEGLKKGAIATIFFRKRMGKKDACSIMSIHLET